MKLKDYIIEWVIGLEIIKKQEIITEEMVKAVLSAPIKNVAYEGREFIRVEIVRNGEKFQAAMYTKTQVFHKNMKYDEIVLFADELFGSYFTQINAWCGEYERFARVTKRGKVLASKRKMETTIKKHLRDNFDRKKNYIINEGDNIPALVDMGVFTKEGKVAASMNDKFRQINRFVELIADEVKIGKIDEGAMVNIIDFGCGKSYLTFVVYHYLTQVRRLRVRMCGLDLMGEVIEKCNLAAQRYGYSSLEFKTGDIGSLKEPTMESWGGKGTFNMIICLHACDTATDHAIFNAIRWKADLICAVPCCQKELNAQMRPKVLSVFNEYGVIRERVAALATDAIRAKLLEYTGYRVQVLEFVDMEVTPKNLFIRARRTQDKTLGAKNEVMGKIEALVEEFSFKPLLLNMIRDFEKEDKI